MSKSSQMPDGGYVPTYGSNLMLDAFEFDSEYGEGPARARKDPDPDLPRSQNGLAALPDGFTGTPSPDDLDYRLLEAGDEGGVGDLGFLSKSASEGLIDLSWLESAEQDPDRLPESPREKMLGELAHAWGKNRRTDGVHLVPNVEYPEPPPSHGAALPGDPRPSKMTLPARQKFRDIVAHAMRLSALGEPLDRIAHEVAVLAGPDLIRDPKLASALRAVRAEHGAVGKVYVRDSAFPGLLTGKWDAAIKKRCASARYWLTTPGSKLAAYDRYLGKQVVTEIPWADALEQYRPMLDVSGKRVASDGSDPASAKIALLSALAAESIRSRKEATFPIQPVDSMTFREAQKLFSETPSQVRAVVQKNAAETLKRKVEAQFAAWQKAGLLSQDDARKILARKTDDPRDHLLAAGPIIATAKRARYEGQGVGVSAPQSLNTRDAGWVEKQEKALAKAEDSRVRAAFDSLVKSGNLAQSDADEILASGLPLKEMVRLAGLKVSKVAARKYEGPVFQTSQTVKRASAPTEAETPVPVKKVLRWASVQMNEGMAGNDLDHLLRAKFAEDLLKQADGPLTQLRKKHEGLAGHVYVDASVYASPRGVTGCEQGALIHRANQIKALLQMERCGSCAANVESTCQKYAKKLVTSAPVTNPDRYRRETIRLANGTDADQVQAMFNAYDPGEFDLQNDNLDTLEYDDSPAPSYLNDVLFGGLDLSEDM